MYHQKNYNLQAYKYDLLAGKTSCLFESHVQKFLLNAKYL